MKFIGYLTGDALEKWTEDNLANQELSTEQEADIEKEVGEYVVSKLKQFEPWISESVNHDNNTWCKIETIL